MAILPVAAIKQNNQPKDEAVNTSV